VLLGPNGSGKTTLLRLFARDLVPRAGEIRLCAEDGSPLPASRIGYATDGSVHFDELTGHENAHWFVRAAGGTAAAADALLERFSLGRDADRPVGDYSFGMRRKVVLIEALAHAPSLVLLDEPTVGLDPDSARTLEAVLDERLADGAAVVIATNDTRIANGADRIAFVHRGRIVANDSPAALLESVRGSTRIEVELDSPVRGPVTAPGDTTRVETPTGLHFISPNGTADLPAICEAIVGGGGRIRRIDVREPGFEDVFRRLTGDALEDDATAVIDEPVQPESRRRRRRRPGRG